MLYSITVHYTPAALNALMDNPTHNRGQAIARLMEAAGGKLLSIYSLVDEGPGAMAIVDLPDHETATAIIGVVLGAGAVRDVKLVRLLDATAMPGVRAKAAELRAVYATPG
jgi:uncharacterized protein with GYD domain